MADYVKNRKKLGFLFLLSISILFIVSCTQTPSDSVSLPSESPKEITPSCIPQVECSAWSKCNSEGIQIKTCITGKNCGEITTSVESQTCIPCTPAWECSIWSTCDSGLQTRSCRDTNKCNNLEGKPKEIQSCIIPPKVDLTKAEIIQENSFKFEDILGRKYFSIFGFVKNIGDTDLWGGLFASGWGGKTRIKADFYDTNNQLVGTESYVFWANSIKPNQISPFVICYENEFSASTYTLSISEEATTTQFYDDFEVIEHRLIKGETGDLKIIGKVKNNGQERKVVEFIVILYDNRKQILATQTYSLNYESPKPQETTTFEISIPNRPSCFYSDFNSGNLESVDGYDIYAQENLGVMF